MGLHLWEQGTGDRLETVKQILSHILTPDDKSLLCDQGLKSFNTETTLKQEIFLEKFKTFKDILFSKFEINLGVFFVTLKR